MKYHAAGITLQHMHLLYLLPNIISYMHHILYKTNEISVLKVCSIFCKLECSYRRHQKIERLGCQTRCFHTMDIHHAWSNSELLYQCNFDNASSVSVTNDKEHCEWVQLQATLIAPVLSISFSMTTNLTVINCQFWTALAPALYICGQERGEDTRNIGTSHPTLSQRCSNGVVSARFCSKLERCRWKNCKSCGWTAMFCVKRI